MKNVYGIFLHQLIKKLQTVLYSKEIQANMLATQEFQLLPAMEMKKHSKSTQC